MEDIFRERRECELQSGLVEWKKELEMKKAFSAVSGTKHLSFLQFSFLKFELKFKFKFILNESLSNFYYFLSSNLGMSLNCLQFQRKKWIKSKNRKTFET